MADGALAPSPALPTDQPGPLAGKSDLKKTNPLAEAESAIDKGTADLQGIETRKTQEMASHERLRDSATPPTLKQVPQPTEQLTDPQHAWSSSAMVLAALGSLFTRHPLTTAINSAAATINAFHKGDTEAFSTAFKSWQVASQNAMELYDYQQKAYERILAQADRLDRLSVQDAANQEHIIQAEIQAASAKFRDNIMADQAKINGARGAVEVYEGRQRGFEAYVKSRKDLESFGLQNEAMNAWRKENPAPDPKTSTPAQQRAWAEAGVQEWGKLQAQTGHAWTQQQAGKQVTSMQSGLDKSAIGKAWNGVAESYPDVAKIVNEAYDHPEAIVDGVRRGVISASVVTDLFTRAFNGGNAMRGFQVKMTKDDMSVMEQADKQYHQWFGRGGAVPADVIRDMAAAIKLSTREIDKHYADAVKAQKSALVDMGIDPHLAEDVAPPNFKKAHPEIQRLLGGGGGGKAPPPYDVDILKKSPTPRYRKHFDETYGPGAAARVLGQ